MVALLLLPVRVGTGASDLPAGASDRFDDAPCSTVPGLPAMTTVALLRGVNVGGVRFAMRDLAEALEAAGLTGVRTVLASGNVLLDGGARGEAEVAAAVHDVVLARFGFDVAVVAVPLATVERTVAAFPFPRDDDRHAYAVFATDPAALAGLAEAGAGLDPAVEAVRSGPGVLYWAVPRGSTLSSAFGRRLAQRAASGAVTTRNLRTLERILAAG